MATETKKTETTKAAKPVATVDYSKLYVGVWSDVKGTPGAVACAFDKADAKKLSMKLCAKIEKSGTELPNFAIHVVTLSK